MIPTTKKKKPCISRKKSTNCNQFIVGCDITGYYLIWGSTGITSRKESVTVCSATVVMGALGLTK